MANLKIDEIVFDKLAEILKKHNLNEIEYKDGDVKIRMSTGREFVSSGVQYNVSAPQSHAASQALPQVEKQDLGYADHPGAVKSPMVGTCYRAPEPGAKDFVSVGDSVKEGQPLVIIEAMKVMNLIKAPKSGNIKHIAIEDSSPVEFGQLLVVIE